MENEALEKFEVRVWRYDDNEEKYIQYLQHMRVGQRYQDDGVCTQYLAAVSGAIGIEISLKKGFEYGRTGGISVKIMFSGTKKLIARINLPKPYSGQSAREVAVPQGLPQDAIFISSIPNAIVDGTYKSDVNLVLIPVSPGQFNLHCTSQSL
jgi:hypothetical protein